MDLAQAHLIRDMLAGTGLVERTQEFARALRRSTRSPGGLILVGPPRAEPWHLTAHLEDEARYADLPELAPTLVRWRPPPGAPPHLAVGLERLTAARRGDALLVVAEDESVPLLERVEDVRHRGARIFALESGQPDLASLAHEVVAVEEEPLLSFDGAQHLVSLAAGEAAVARGGLRGRLGRLLDALSGPDPS